MRWHLEAFVKSDLLVEGQSLKKTRRRFYPTNKDIYNHMCQARVAHGYSTLDQNNVDAPVAQWEKDSPRDAFFYINLSKNYSFVRPSRAKPREFERKIYLYTYIYIYIYIYMFIYIIEDVCSVAWQQWKTKYEWRQTKGRLLGSNRLEARQASSDFVGAKFAYIGKVFAFIAGSNFNWNVHQHSLDGNISAESFPFLPEIFFCERLHWRNYTFCGRGKIIFRGK